jgi:hypothetical protein
MISLFKLLIIAFLVVHGLHAEYEAKAPEDPKDVHLYSFGSLIRDKDSFLHGILTKSSVQTKSDNNEKSIKVKEVKENISTEL